MKKYKTVLGLLSQKNKWTKGVFAKDKNGESVGPLNPAAEKFCLVGAIQYVYPVGQRTDKTKKVAKAIKKIYGCNSSYYDEAKGGSRGSVSLMSFNDDTNKQALIKVLKEAKV